MLYGGRGAGRSWGVARALLLLGTFKQERILCAREIQNRIADSVHKTLSDQIKLMGLKGVYKVTENTITNALGTEFIFTGLRDMDAKKIKSYEGVTRCWVEEAESVTKNSWDILIPTIRVEGSEIWISFNPSLDTDETYQRFVVNPPSDAWVQKLNYNDNPFFPRVLELERQACWLRDTDNYANIWLGEPKTAIAGAIFGREVHQMVEDKRIRPVPYDPSLLVHTIWDLGWNDQTSIVFAQRLHSEVRIIDYEEQSFLRYDEWARLIKDKPYTYGSHFLPHDGGNKTQGAKGLSAQDQLEPLLGRRPRIIARAPSIEDKVKAARMVFPRVYMDKDKAGRLHECLRRYRRSVPTTTGEPGKPVHDEFSHGASAFMDMCQIVNELGNEEDAPAVRVNDYLPGVAWMG